MTAKKKIPLKTKKVGCHQMEQGKDKGLRSRPGWVLRPEKKTVLQIGILKSSQSQK